MDKDFAHGNKLGIADICIPQYEILTTALVFAEIR